MRDNWRNNPYLKKEDKDEIECIETHTKEVSEYIVLSKNTKINKDKQQTNKITGDKYRWDHQVTLMHLLCPNNDYGQDNYKYICC